MRTMPDEERGDAGEHQEENGDGDGKRVEFGHLFKDGCGRGVECIAFGFEIFGGGPLFFRLHGERFYQRIDFRRGHLG